MNEGRTIFSQLMEHAPHHDFRKCVERYRGNHAVRRFRCWDQFLCMAFAQLTYRESLRDISACLNAVPERLYHMGIRASVTASRRICRCVSSSKNRSTRFSQDQPVVVTWKRILGFFASHSLSGGALCTDELSRMKCTSTLFAALDIATGEIVAESTPRQRHQEFLRFAKKVVSGVDPGLGI